MRLPSAMKLLAFLLLLPLAAFGQTTVIISENTVGDFPGDFDGVEDAELTEQDGGDDNSGSATELFVSNFSDPTTRNLVVCFPSLAADIPNGITVTAAALHVRGLNVGSGLQITAYRLLRTPVEAQMTWTIYSTGNNWTTAGALSSGNDRAASNSGVTSSIGGSTWFAISEDNATFMSDIEDMADGTGSPCWGLYATSATGTFEQFGSSEFTDGFRPALEFTYTAPGGGVLLLRRRRN